MVTDQKELYKLLTLMSEGDKPAFGQFYDSTISRTFSVIMRITSNKELAEEVASDVYMQAWRTAINYDPTLAAPMTWLTMIARSRSIDALRREKSATRNQFPLIEDYDVADEETPGPLTEALGEEKSAKLKELLRLLDAPERQMIILAFYRGMSHNEIAAYTGKPLGSVKTILRRAQAVMRSALSKTYFFAQMSPEVM